MEIFERDAPLGWIAVGCQLGPIPIENPVVDDKDRIYGDHAAAIGARRRRASA
jgi:hypothetical protein